MSGEVAGKPLVWQRVLLAIGIYVAPYIFAWVTLREGYSRVWRVISFSWAILLLTFVMLFLVVGGDSWPIQFQNRTGNLVRLQYLHKDYGYWSAELPLEPGAQSQLARGHWFKDVRGLRVFDGATVYSASPTVLSDFHKACDQASLCVLSYLGAGRLAAKPS